jgi:subtilisin family serine protease
MKNLKASISIILVVFFFTVSSAQETEQVPGLLQVKFKKEASFQFGQTLKLESIKNTELKNYLSKIGFKESRKIFSSSVEDDTLGIDKEGNNFKKADLSRWYLVSFDDENEINTIKEKILKYEDVEYVCPVTKYKVDFIPNDFYFISQTGLRNGSTGRDIHATQAWDYNTGRSDVKVAVVDAGVDYYHPDLDPGNRSRVIAGYDAADGDNDPMDDLPSQYSSASHGTKVAGVIGAITNNNTGVAGIMHNLQIIPVKVFATNGPWWDPFSWTAGSAYDPWIASGINYAANNGAKVINLSLGGYGLSGWENLWIGNPVGEAVYNAYHQGVLIIASAGNDNTSALHFPSAFPGVMGIAAVSNNDVKASFSNYGSYISVCAPGNYDENYTTKRSSQYDYFAGTSCSAPMVSGSAGLIISEALDRGISLTNDDVKHLLEASAEDLGDSGWDQLYGYGRINVGRALERLNFPYTVTTQTIYNSSGQEVQGSHQHQFYNNGGLATGNYLGVKTYKVSGHITFPVSYSAIPYVWVRERECVGWNYDNGNLELPWVKITNITSTGFDYETVIYWIGYDAIGQEINKYWPGNSSSLQAKIVYTAVGVPMQVNSTLSASQFPEGGGSGGTYELNGNNIGETYSGTAYYGSSLAAVPPNNNWSFYHWSDGNISNPRTLTADFTGYAVYKAIHKSTDATAFSNNSQRRLIETLSGGTTWLHQVYTSMGHVWIEHSSDGGNSWIVGNNGQTCTSSSLHSC